MQTAAVVGEASDAAARERCVRAYHERSKHRPERYAPGPETLDWDAQPDPFRRYAGAPVEPLPLPAGALAATRQPSWSELFVPGAVAPRALSRSAVGLLFELSVAISAWKRQGPDRWAVRCNPSSGNLHPTEAYLIAHGVTGLDDGIYHYAPREHALERRAAGAPGLAAEQPRLWVGFVSIHWREAWKYGERAFRYCQLDIGHALGALRYAAAVLGWRARVVEGLEPQALAALLGVDRDDDFGAAEREEPELLVELHCGGAEPAAPAAAPGFWPASTCWQGRANRLDRHPMYRWPAIDEVARASRGAYALATPGGERPAPAARDVPAAQAVAAELIRQRRSAQRFDARRQMPADAFARLVQALAPAGLPWDLRPAPARVHLVLFANRVDGLAAGAYALPRSAAGETAMRRSFAVGLEWEPVPLAAKGPPPLFRLAANPALAGTLRTLNCHQALGADAMLAVAMLAEFDGPLAARPSNYRELLHEAGLAGQVLYLESEAAGLRGTGIGCFFDDALHELLGLRGSTLQSLYHFTVGAPLADLRIASEPPYPGRTDDDER